MAWSATERMVPAHPIQTGVEMGCILLQNVLYHEKQNRHMAGRGPIDSSSARLPYHGFESYMEPFQHAIMFRGGRGVFQCGRSQVFR